MRRQRTIDAVLLLVLVGVLVLIGGAQQWSTAALTLSEEASSGSVAPQPAWNFLIVVVDTLRYDATSMSGQPNTPFIKRVAERGVSFSRAFSPHDSTPPSHFTLFTGLREGYGLANDRPDMGLPYQLRSRGYSTFGVAANGNLSQKWMQTAAGFVRYSNLYDDWNEMGPEGRAHYLPGINARLRQYGARENEWNQAQLFCSGAEVLTRFRGMLASTSEPFLGFVNIIEPHDPYLPSLESLGQEPPWARQVDPDVRFRQPEYPLAHPEGYPDAAGREYILKRLQILGGRRWSLSDDLSAQALGTYRRRYAASALDADRIVRAIFLELERKRMIDRTWVVIVSDHGESFGEDGFMTHSLADKGNPEASYHVPMVWAVPVFGNGATVDADVSLADVAPTVYDLAGIDWTPLKAKASGEFGRSLIQYLDSKASAASATAVIGDDPTKDERQRSREGAMERLRALGYIQ